MLVNLTIKICGVWISSDVYCLYQVSWKKNRSSGSAVEIEINTDNTALSQTCHFSFLGKEVMLIENKICEILRSDNAHLMFNILNQLFNKFACFIALNCIYLTSYFRCLITGDRPTVNNYVKRPLTDVNVSYFQISAHDLSENIKTFSV